MPISSNSFLLCSGSMVIFTPSASRQSAAPDLELAARLPCLATGTPAAEITRAILNGEKGPKRNAVLLNAAAALYVAGKADSMADGVKLAEKVIDTGLAKAQLERFIKLSNA